MLYIFCHISDTIHWKVVCTKVREGDKRIVRLKEGDCAGCHVVIVDDLVQSGGTLIECQVFLLVFLPLINEFEHINFYSSDRMSEGVNLCKFRLANFHLK